MKINLLDVKVVCICPAHNAKYKARQVHMKQLFEKVGFHDYEFFQSGTQEYPNCLNIATRDIMKKYRELPKPVLVLEDDVDFETGMPMTIELPDDSDALYLGISKACSSYFENRFVDHVPSKFRKTEIDGLFRVVNMLSAHAVLQISSKYKQFVYEDTDKVVQLGKRLGSYHWNDVHFARYQRFFQIYALSKPHFYQSNQFQGHEGITRFQITDAHVTEDFVL